jgi:hypothetical protein
MRTVIEDECVSTVIDLEQAIYPRLGDAFEALKWWLARRPDSGVLLDDINWICRQHGDRGQNVPSLVAIYTFDHRNVVIKFVLVRLPSV